MPPMGKVVYTVRSVLEGHGEEFNRWQAEEHIPILLTLPGYVAVSRYEQEDRAEAFMNVWDVESRAAFDSPKHGLVDTPWKARIAPLRKEHRVDFYDPLPDGLFKGPASAEDVQRLVRFEGPADAEPALRAMAAQLADRPGVSHLRLLRDQAAGGAIVLLCLEAEGAASEGLGSPAGVSRTAYRRIAAWDVTRPPPLIQQSGH